MDSLDFPNGNASARQDAIVVDRAALIKLLSAVADALEVSLSLDQLDDQPDLDAQQLQAVREEVRSARRNLLAGVRRVIDSIEQLPTAGLEQEEHPRDDAAGEQAGS